MNAKKKALGKGLSALLSDSEPEIIPQDYEAKGILNTVSNISIDLIESNPYQPRTQFEEESLKELANSIQEQGIIQPLTVRKIKNNKYQLISGERRLKAAEIIKMEEVPVYIRLAEDNQMLVMALVENIQREDLNPMEIAISYQRLIEECDLTQNTLSKHVGKNRTTITNYIRLLKLPAEIQAAIRDNKISMGHARAIINIDRKDKQIKIMNLIIEKDLSVREVELLVRKLNQPEKITTVKNDKLPEQYIQIKNNLSEKLQAKIVLKRNNKGKGSIVIPFSSDEEFMKIIETLE
ncbi:ParB/RepB/Spo0J family partition protein [Bacteroidota bacterium]